MPEAIHAGTDEKWLAGLGCAITHAQLRFKALEQSLHNTWEVRIFRGDGFTAYVDEDDFELSNGKPLTHDQLFHYYLTGLR